MVTLGNLSYLVYDGFVNVIFGDVTITAIIGTIAIFALMYKSDVPGDASLILLLGWFIVLGVGMFVPIVINLIIWIVIALILYLIIIAIMER